MTPEAARAEVERIRRGDCVHGWQTFNVRGCPECDAEADRRARRERLASAVFLQTLGGSPHADARLAYLADNARAAADALMAALDR